MRLVGITGSIGSGKSTLAKILENDHICIDADDLAREAVTKGSKGLSQITQAFGSQILAPDYELDRKKIAEIVFNDPEKLKTLNSIVHPEVHRLRGLAFHQAYQKDPSKIIFYIVPLLFENQMQSAFQKVILVTTTQELQLKRLTEKRGFSALEAQARINNQMAQDEKAKLADYIVENTGDIANLKSQLAGLLKGDLAGLPPIKPKDLDF